MNIVENPSGCMSIRIRHAHRVTLLQRIARAFATGSVAWAEQLDQLGSRA